MSLAGASVVESSDTCFVRDLSARFARAAERHDVERVYTVLAGRSLALEFAGAGLKKALTAALVHTVDRTRSCDFTIKFYDTQSTGVAPPPPPGRALLERGFDRGQTGRLRRTYCAVSGTLQVYDLERSCAYYWIRDARYSPPAPPR